MTSDQVKEHIFNVDGNWGTMDFPASLLPEPVLAIRFCADTNFSNAQSPDGRSPTNHWSFFLEIAHSKSVRVEALPGEPETPGMIVVQQQNNDATEEAERVWSIADTPPTGTTVSTILGLIISGKRDRYILAPVGEGCRSWMLTVGADLVTAGLLNPSIFEQASYALDQYWPHPRGTASEARAIEHGKFY